jgi:hypothetical protein
MPYQTRGRYRSLALLAILATLLLAACSPGSGGAAAGTTSDGYSRTGAAAAAAPSAGASEAGSVTITVTADDGSFDSKPIAGGATFSQAFPKAGTYTYHCAIHSSMTGTVVVQ